MANANLKVTCSTKDAIELEDLKDFQGDLKSLSEPNYKRLKFSLVKYGFSFPFFVWNDKGTKYVLDGHQRLKVLAAMKDEGYKIPPLPVVFVDAKNRKEAKEKLLAATSRFGVIDHQGMYSYLVDAEISIEDLPQFDFADLHLENFMDYYKSANDKPTAEDRKKAEEELDEKMAVNKEYLVIISADNEEEQAELFQELSERGFQCKVMN